MLSDPQPPTRKCVSCRATKELGYFYRAEGFALGHMDECKLCHGMRMERERRSSILDRNEAKRIVQDAKNRPCMDCGGQFMPRAMEFDHVPERGDKLFNLSQVPTGADVTMIHREMAKCDVVCANCHRARTAGRKALRPKKSLRDKLLYQLEKHPYAADMVAADRGMILRGELPPRQRKANGRYTK
jgi:hypothetical protein